MSAGAGTDFHNHLVPGVDDGSGDLAESRAALVAMAGAGVGTVITTPHFEGSLTLAPLLAAERLAEIDAGWNALTGDAAAAATGVRLLRGVELLLDVPNPDVSDPRLRLNGTRFVLVEYPSMQLPELHADFAMRSLRDRGYQPVLAHPERYRNVSDSLEELLPLRYAGAYFQVNAGSLLGFHGRGAQARAEALIARGWAEYSSSDFHARGELAIAGARAALVARGAEAQAELLFVTNPARLVRDEAPLPVEPVTTNKKARPWWARLLGR